MSLQRGINLRSLAEKMGNCSGAEVRGICTEAGQSFYVFALLTALSLGSLTGMYALRERRQNVSQEDFELAVRFPVAVNALPLMCFRVAQVAKILKKNADSDTSTSKLYT